MAARSSKWVEFVYRDHIPKDISHLHVHPTTKIIAYAAFSHSWKLVDVKLNEGLEDISNAAFMTANL